MIAPIASPKTLQTPIIGQGNSLTSKVGDIYNASNPSTANPTAPPNSPGDQFARSGGFQPPNVRGWKPRLRAQNRSPAVDSSQIVKIQDGCPAARQLLRRRI